jgi:hypothetical protein
MSPMDSRKTMSVGERDKLMSDIATKAADAFCRKCVATGTNDEMIEAHPEAYLDYTIPYLTVRTLHSHEQALKSLKTDSRWIKWSAIATTVLTAVLIALTAVLAMYALRLDRIIHSLSQ